MMTEAAAKAAIRHLWQRHRITYKPIVTIVFDMALDSSRSYEAALEDWAATQCGPPEQPIAGKRYSWPASRWHSEICYRLLKAGEECPGGVAAWFKAEAKEVRQLAEGNDLGACPGTGQVVAPRGGAGTPDGSTGTGSDDLER